MKWVAALLLSGASAVQLRESSKAMGLQCGDRDFVELPQAQQDYYKSLEEARWLHPSTKATWSVFKEQTQCTFALMMSKVCFGLAPNAERKANKAFWAACADPAVTYSQVYTDYMSMEERKQWEALKGTSQQQATAINVAPKENLCGAMHVVDDECGMKYMRVQKPADF